MRVDWTESALRCLEDILGYIAKDDVAAAHRLVDDIIDSTEAALTDHPHAGRPGRVADTREWVAHKRYIVAYRIHQDRVQILSVMHTSRLWPGSF